MWMLRNIEEIKAAERVLMRMFRRKANAKANYRRWHAHYEIYEFENLKCSDTGESGFQNG